MEQEKPIPARKTLLGVPYDHYQLADGADLYVTTFGRPFLSYLWPENWLEPEWFGKSRQPLQGTSTVYKLRTKPVAGTGKDLVVKWCRVGEEVPIDTCTRMKFMEMDFNSPYEEFSLLMEMRARARPGTVRTHKPLAIFVPARRLKLWQTGRSRSKMDGKKAQYLDVELDIFRQYILIYEWIKGVASTEAAAAEAAVSAGYADASAFARAMLERSMADMKEAGFHVLDAKPQHAIVRPRRGGGLLKDRSGRPAYALVDFELLARTPEYERQSREERRRIYLERQRDRFRPAEHPREFPPHLHSARILGVDYVHGDCDSTRGKLWVVGHDPHLFDYFLPERWRRTPRRSLSDTAQVYYTKTKDGIQLVWKVSQVGDPSGVPDTSPAFAAWGCNSPFEEFGFALQLAAAGVPTTYPRAIYMLGHQSTLPPEALDPRRYESHRDLRMPDGAPVLQRERNYITVWGYWNGTDEVVAGEERQRTHCRGVNGAQALSEGRIDAVQLEAATAKMGRLLAGAGVESSCLLATHYVLTLTPEDELLRDPDGTLAVRLCNFEFLRRRG
ncbi:MAG: hypothetical protein EOM10_05025 [Opitutae bacterium]|nr:hypothetical protein [Opitutae bacterium]